MAVMGTANNEEEKETFGTRLIDAVKEAGGPVKPRKKISIWFDKFHNIQISGPMISRYIKNDEIPRMDQCREYAIALGVRVDWLLTGRPPKRPMAPLTDLEQALIEEIRKIDEENQDEKTRVLLNWLQVDTDISARPHEHRDTPIKPVTLHQEVENSYSSSTNKEISPHHHKPMLNLFHKDPARLLHEATQKKERGDIDGAIESLQVAYSAIIKTTMDHTVQTFLRLPLYLQQAGKPDEAWAEFNKLLLSGYPNQLEDRDLWPMTRSQIYDKMRLFLQRENRPDEAIRFGIFSYLSWGEGLDAQGRLTELRQHRSVKSIEKRLGALLKKASKAKKKSDLSGLVAKSLREPESMDYDSIGELVANLLTE